jgi:hypothetical protein
MRIFHNVRVIARLQIHHAAHSLVVAPSIWAGGRLRGAVDFHVTVRSKYLAVPRATLKRIGVAGLLRCLPTVQSIPVRCKLGFHGW